MSLAMSAATTRQHNLNASRLACCAVTCNPIGRIHHSPLESDDHAGPSIFLSVSAAKHDTTPDPARSLIPQGSVSPEFRGLCSRLERSVILRFERNEQWFFCCRFAHVTLSQFMIYGCNRCFASKNSGHFCTSSSDPLASIRRTKFRSTTRSMFPRWTCVHSQPTVVLRYSDSGLCIPPSLSDY